MALFGSETIWYIVGGIAVALLGWKVVYKGYKNWRESKYEFKRIDAEVEEKYKNAHK